MPRRAGRTSKSKRKSRKKRSLLKRPALTKEPSRKERSRTSRAISPKRPASEVISAEFKTLTIALEPPKRAELTDLHPQFRARLAKVLEDLSAAGTPFRFVEGFRTTERQQWLYGSGRPAAKFGRP